ncbi:MAG TPA: RNA methyltransferase [Pyrinomonadaceae bacterium]|jgi:TrmH family RNA methyltransferase|nr:RNA methyltransferase [Pyrinomonadaceae bacterium]
MITSRDNPHLKHARAVRKGKVSAEMFIEGLRLCEEAVRSNAGSNINITSVLYTPDFAVEPRSKALLAELKNRGIEGLLVPETLLDSVTDTSSPQGIVITAEKPVSNSGVLTGALNGMAAQPGNLPLVLILHEINNPANLGAILRTVEAAGAIGVVITKNSADPFSPKALRGAMGASLRLPVWYGAEFSEAIDWAKQNEMAVACADINGKTSYLDVDWQKPHALVIGSEAHGLTPDEITLCDESFRIPMAEPVESLNAAVAAGIVLFEARRQFRQQT